LGNAITGDLAKAALGFKHTRDSSLQDHRAAATV
jgi:hypothetical protein